MIKFFRKIRYDLMEKNKTGKYLKYAIGEIVLVVIGILIALQLNNWSEQNKSNLFEVKILSELQNDLRSNYLELSSIKKNYIKAIIKSDSLIEIIKERSFDIHSHSKLLIYLDPGTLGTTNISNTTYNFIENNGFEILTNDSLRISISDLYTRRIYNVLNMEKVYNNFYDKTTWPYLSSKFIIVKTNHPIPIDLKTFEDLEFKNILNKRARLLTSSNIIIGICIRDLEVLIKEIEKEIAKIKD
jgi:hypothetical protein